MLAAILAGITVGGALLVIRRPPRDETLSRAKQALAQEDYHAAERL